MLASYMAIGKKWRPIDIAFFLTPVAFLILACIEIRSPRRGLGLLSWQDASVHFVADMITLHSLHVVLTYACLLTMPECKSWLREKTTGRSWAFWAGSSSVVALLFVLLILGGAHLGKANAVNWQMSILLFSLRAFAASLHGLGQVKGISLMMNRRLTENSRTCVLEPLEKTGFQMMFNFLWMAKIAVVFKAFRLWPMIPIYETLFLGSLLAAFVILVVSTMYGHIDGWLKFLFLSRVLLYPLGLVSGAAAIGTMVNHGIEYYLIQKNMLANSRISSTQRRTFVILTVVFSALWVAGKFQNYIVVSEYRGPFLVTLAAFVYIFDYVHYYLDRVMFRMRDPVARSNIAPLLR